MPYAHSKTDTITCLSVIFNLISTFCPCQDPADDDSSELTGECQAVLT